MKTLREYIDILESLEQGVREGIDQPIGYIDSADGSLITIGHRPGFAKKHGYKDGGFIDGPDRAIPNAWKPVYQKDLQQDIQENELEETQEDPIERIDRLFQDR